MRITSFKFSRIKSFESAVFDLTKTSVLIGQNDHGKSSILKAIDIVLNGLDDDTLEAGSLHPDLAERLLPIFPSKSKSARRITVHYENAGVPKELHLTFRVDLTFTIQEVVTKPPSTTSASLAAFKALRASTRFVLIPALRDASSQSFQDLLSKLLQEHGLSKIIPQKRGGTAKEYRVLRGIHEKVSKDIQPFINEKLLPEVAKHFGFQTEHKLALKLDVDVQDVGEWILQHLRLGFEMTSDEGASTLALSEAGSGVQSGVLLALRRLEQNSSQNPNVQFILAVEEPEAFLHPQRQKELYQDIRKAESSNLRIIVTTHSPYIVGETPFARLGLVRKCGLYSSLHVATISSLKEQEMFDSYNNDTNALLLFAEKVLVVEGESDARVLRVLLQKKLGAAAHRYSIVSAAGNANFSPFLKMIHCWKDAKIPHLVVTDFDSLTKSTDRAVLVGAAAAGYELSEKPLHAVVDRALAQTTAQEFTAAAVTASDSFRAAGLNVFVFTSDLEYSLVSSANVAAVGAVLNSVATGGADYRTGYTLAQIQRALGSKGVPLGVNGEPPFKKPFIHEKVAHTIELSTAHPDISRLLEAIEAL